MTPEVYEYESQKKRFHQYSSAKNPESSEAVSAPNPLTTDCPSCGAPVDRFDTQCKYCGMPYAGTRFVGVSPYSQSIPSGHLVTPDVVVPPPSSHSGSQNIIPSPTAPGKKQNWLLFGSLGIFVLFMIAAFLPKEPSSKPSSTLRTASSVGVNRQSSGGSGTAVKRVTASMVANAVIETPDGQSETLYASPQVFCQAMKVQGDEVTAAIAEHRVVNDRIEFSVRGAQELADMTDVAIVGSAPANCSASFTTTLARIKVVDASSNLNGQVGYTFADHLTNK